MSSATVLFVLRVALDATEPNPLLLTTRGPGFTIALMLTHPCFG